MPYALCPCCHSDIVTVLGPPNKTGYGVSPAMPRLACRDAPGLSIVHFKDSQLMLRCLVCHHEWGETVLC